MAIVAALAALGGEPARAEVAVLHELGLSLAAPTGLVAAVSYTPTLSVAGDRLYFGAGLRLSSYFDQATVEYPNGDPGLLAAGAHNTLRVRHPRTYAVNAMIAVAVRVIGDFELGANIDVVGVGFGPGVTGSYSGTTAAFDGAQPGAPTTLNLLLLGTHDRGQLDSELFAAIWFGRWGLRAGVSHMSTEFTTSRVLDGGNDRFRASASRFFVAVGHRAR